jgi:hypothetical protein
MSAQERKLALKNAVLEWQRKFGVNDGDPILASLELFQIYMESHVWAERDTGPKLPAFDEFRDLVETLDTRTREFVRQTDELIRELRKLSGARQTQRGYYWYSLIVVAVLATALGVALSHILFQA